MNERKRESLKETREMQRKESGLRIHSSWRGAWESGNEAIQQTTHH